MTFCSLPTLGVEVSSQPVFSKTLRESSVGRAVLPPLPCPRPVKLRPKCDRSCTRKISNACVGEPSDSFSMWSSKASGLRPSFMRSGVTADDNKSQRQRCEQTLHERPNCDDASPARKFRQRILQEVKIKLGAGGRAMQRPSVFVEEAGPNAINSSQGVSDWRKPDSQMDERVNELAIPVKIARPKGPEFPGARRTKEQPAIGIEHTKHRADADTTHDESDGIFEDDGSGCDSDF
eukprot:gnl/MRDRNA2_/MRDRNA2_29233_c0_seq1.p1 gnl/MRDRNA2_/MRDRNA2_29233_c0~~gnl/MRDRNA2_/MRDRNA2_29233_c0_seq1.p1  ORF type:complete len:235 (+),score=37.88 gnl/MRDRNA2_/MRDRNA2_29233_c0_seq1:74-778(+)